ncbi:MAG: MiaB/RimO family radical SAM methylthiotransferase [Anaerolineaceae bacterium]
MKVFLGSIGCRLNQSEVEMLAAELRSAGHEIVAVPEQAQAAIVNSCTVTAAAEADSRQLVHRLQRLGVEKIYLTGCWVSVDDSRKENLVDGATIIPNQKKMNIVKIYFGGSTASQSEGSVRIPLPGKARRTRAFIKVQEGCDYHCTFCITRVARGKSVSRPLDEIMRDIESAIRADVKEVVLTGTQLGGWGRDFSDQKTIAFLVNTILEQTSIPRVRLSSIEPWDIKPDFYPFFSNPRFCDHLHLPLQSGSSSTLKRMGRTMPSSDYFALLQKIRSLNPNIAITTDIVIGFPGESEEEFVEGLHFVEEAHFAGGHVFRYSPRAGTPAADYSGQIDGLEKRKRNERMRAVLQRSAVRYRAGFLGKNIPVLWERGQKHGDDLWTMEGLSTNYLRVQAESTENLWNMISSVTLREDHKKYLYGEIERQSQ